MPDRTKTTAATATPDVAIVDEIKQETSGLHRSPAEILAELAREGRHVVRPVAHQDEDGMPMISTQGGRFAIVAQGSGERISWGSSLASFLARARAGAFFYVSKPSTVVANGLFEIKAAKYESPTPANCEKLAFRGTEGPHVVFHEIGNDKKVYVLPLDRCYLWGFASIEEMELLQEAGFHPLEVIRSATMYGAQAIFEPKGKEIEFGVLRPGLKADIVLIRENPLHNLKVLYGMGAIKLDQETGAVNRIGGVRWTIKDGIVYDAKKLLTDVRKMVDKQKAERAAKADAERSDGDGDGR